MWDWAYLIPLVGIGPAFGIAIVSIIYHYRLQTKRAEIISAAIESGADIPDAVLAWMEKKKSDEERKHEKEMALIEKGLYESYQQRRSLKAGIILSSLGIAFTIFSIVVSKHGAFLEGGVETLLPGLILLFLGIGFIVWYYLSRREKELFDENSES